MSQGAIPLDLPLAYPVFVGRGLLAQAGAMVMANAEAHRYAVVSDATVASHHAATLLAGLPADRSRLFTIPPGETEKTRAKWASLTDAMFAWGAGRDTTVVALGGGVVGDLAGFVAATFMRGVPVVQVPTTLLAMVDAAVGGKTGVDTSHGKNLVGAFHDPAAVIMAVETLESLPERTLRSGLAEVMKHGIIADRGYLDRALAALPSIGRDGGRSDTLTDLVAGSVRIKAGVVAQDRREAGLRQILNFGHTIAHAVETLLDYGILHGEAVAIGMVVESRIAELAGVGEPGLTEVVIEAVRRARLPDALPSGLSDSDILTATRGDKKNRGGSVRYTLPVRAGEMSRGDGSWSTPIDDEIVIQALRASRR